MLWIGPFCSKICLKWYQREVILDVKASSQMVLLDTFWNSTEQQIFKIRPVELIYLSFQFMRLLAAYSSVGATDYVGATGFTIYTYSVQWIRNGAHADDSNTKGPAMDWQKKQHLLDWNSIDLLRLVGEESIFFEISLNHLTWPPTRVSPRLRAWPGKGRRRMALVETSEFWPSARVATPGFKKKNEYIDWIDTQKSMLYCSTVILIFLFSTIKFELALFSLPKQRSTRIKNTFWPICFEVPSPEADIMELRPERSPLLSGMTTCFWLLCFGVALAIFSRMATKQRTD